jgi:hypothetical protein
MRRLIIGILALVLLLIAGALTIWPPAGEGYQQFHAGALRVGVLLAVAWLAYDDARRMPVWLWGAIPALAAVLVLKPKWFLIALPIVIVMLIIRPRNRGRKP